LGKELGRIDPEVLVAEPILSIDQDPDLMIVGIRAGQALEF
jgi:hypothetical protein